MVRGGLTELLGGRDWIDVIPGAGAKGGGGGRLTVEAWLWGPLTAPEVEVVTGDAFDLISNCCCCCWEGFWLGWKPACWDAVWLEGKRVGGSKGGWGGPAKGKAIEGEPPPFPQVGIPWNITFELVPIMEKRKSKDFESNIPFKLAL